MSDMKRIITTAARFRVKTAVCVNKFDTNIENTNKIEEFCKEKGIKILGRVPFEKELGELNSNAKIAARESERYNKLFKNILETVKGEVQHERASYTER